MFGSMGRIGSMLGAQGVKPGRTALGDDEQDPLKKKSASPFTSPGEPTGSVAYSQISPEQAQSMLAAAKMMGMAMPSAPEARAPAGGTVLDGLGALGGMAAAAPGNDNQPPVSGTMPIGQPPKLMPSGGGLGVMSGAIGSMFGDAAASGGQRPLVNIAQQTGGSLAPSTLGVSAPSGTAGPMLSSLGPLMQSMNASLSAHPGQFDPSLEAFSPDVIDAASQPGASLETLRGKLSLPQIMRLLEEQQIA